MPGKPRASLRSKILDFFGRNDEQKRRMWRFLGLFLLQLAVFNALFIAWIVSSGPFEDYLELNAATSAGILRLIGHGDVSAEGALVFSPRCSLTIKQGCDGIQALAIFLAGIIAFPVPWRRKLPGILWGSVFLLTMNLVRIITLYFAQVYRPDWFEMLHVDIWQPVFILLALVAWLFWALKVLPKRSKRDPDSGAKSDVKSDHA